MNGKLKLVTDKKVIKYPREAPNVRATFRRALDKAQKHGAKQVIIITRDSEGCDVSCSGKDLYTTLGMIKRAELMLTEDNI